VTSNTLISRESFQVRLFRLAAADPIAQGLGTSPARPGGNVTGAALGNSELVPKLLELVHDLIPAAGHVSVLGDPLNPRTVELPVSVG
jgi:ABC-type uncharacterized transport system substrate-binding protein